MPVASKLDPIVLAHVLPFDIVEDNAIVSIAAFAATIEDKSVIHRSDSGTSWANAGVTKSIKIKSFFI